MSVTNKFNLVLSNKVANNTYNTTTTPNYLRKISNQADSFESSTKKNQISFKGAQKIPAEIQKMISSNNYWKILGATIATTATALWVKITNNGQNDADLTVEEIENKIRENLPEIFQEQEAEATETTEEVIDIEAKKINEEAKENTTLTLEENKPSEAPKKRRGRPPKNLKLEGGQQPDTSKAVPAKRRQQAGDVELIKTLAEQGLTVSEIETKTGIKAQQIKRIAKKENITLVDARKIKKIKNTENIEEIQAESSQSEATKTITESQVETPKKRRGRPPKNLKLEGGQQLDTNKAVPAKRRQQGGDVELIKSLTEQGLTVSEIETKTGIKAQQIKRIAKKENITLVDARKFKKIKNTENIEEVYDENDPLNNLRKKFDTEIKNLNKIYQYTPEEAFEIYIAVAFRLLAKQGKEKKDEKDQYDAIINLIYKFENNPRTIFEKEEHLNTILNSPEEVIPKNDSFFEEYKNTYKKNSSYINFLELRKNYTLKVLKEIIQSREYFEFKKLANTKEMTPEEILNKLCKFDVFGQIEKDTLTQTELIEESSLTEQIEKLDYGLLIRKLNNYEKIAEKDEELYSRLFDFIENSTESDIETLQYFIFLLEKLSNGEMSYQEINEHCKKSFIIPLNSQIKNSSKINIEEIIPTGPAKATIEKLYKLGDEGYIKFINGEVLNNEPFKNFARKRYLEAQKSNDPISLEDAVQAMKRIDEYLLLSNEEKTHINNIEKIFKADITQVKLRTKSKDKPNNIFTKVLNEIIEKDYKTIDTKVFNEYYNEYAVFPPEFKKEIKGNFIEIMKEIEKSASKKSNCKKEAGILEWENKKHSLEIRLYGNYGGIRVYSKYIGKGKKNFVFTQYFPDHNTKKKN